MKKQVELALTLINQNAENKVIVDTINARYPDLQVISKDISNMRRRFDGVSYNNTNNMHQFIINLESAGYDVCYSTNKNGHIYIFFFTHSNCINRVQYFSEVTIADTTYKSNIYHFPLVNIVGVNNIGGDQHTLSTFGIACTWVSNEKASSFTWALQQLQKTVYGSKGS